MNDKSLTKLLLVALGGMLLIMVFLSLRVSSVNLLVVLITGLTVGGLTCLAVQGGLLASVISAKEEEEIEKGINRKSTIFPTLTFLSAKLVAYMALGFVLGAFGGVIGISQTTQIIMQFIAGLYMVAVGLNLLNTHPIFRYVAIQPPKFLLRKLRNQSKSKDLFAPAFLGAMTVFIPCGTTLAMEALAISSASAFLGAAIMGVFVLGTTPLFFGVGWITSILGDNFRSKFLRIAAIAVLYLGAKSMGGALAAGGLPINFPNQITSTSQNELVDAKVINGVQNVDINVTSYGYTPDFVTVKKGLPVKLNLKANGAYSCASAFRIPSLGVAINLQPNGTDSVTFTPKSSGKIAFTCSMGMYRGVISVI